MKITTDRNVKIIFFIIAFVQMVGDGIFLLYYSIYNIEFIYALNNFSNNPLVSLELGNVVVGFLTEKVQSLYQIPFYFIISSYLSRYLIIICIYYLVDILINNKKIALYLTLFFLFQRDFSTYTMVANGMWGAPIFYRATISSILLLISLNLFIRKRIISGGLILLISMYFHLLNSFTAFIYFIPGLLWYQHQNQSLDLKKWIVAFIIIGFGLYPIIQSGIINIDSSSLAVSTKQWYTYCMTVDPDDVSILYQFGKFGYICCSLLITAFYLTNLKRDKDLLDTILMGSLYILCTLILIELMHYFGIFFGSLSEMYITIQFRRSLWVPLFFSAIVIFRELFNYFDKKNNLEAPDLNYYYLMCLGLVVYSIPTVLTFYLLIGGLIFYHNPFRKLYITILFSSLVLLINGIRVEYITSIALLNNAVFFRVIATTGLILCLYYFIKKSSIKLEFVYALIISILLFFISVNGLWKSRLIDSVNFISKNGLFQSPEPPEFLYKYKNMLTTERYSKLLIDNIHKYNPEKKMILAPNEMSHFDRTIYKSTLFYDKKDYSLSMFRKNIYGYGLEKLKHLGILNKLYDGDELKFQSKDEFIKIITDSYNNITYEMLDEIKSKYDIKLFITHKKYNDLVLCFNDGKYFIYDLQP